MRSKAQYHKRLSHQGKPVCKRIPRDGIQDWRWQRWWYSAQPKRVLQTSQNEGSTTPLLDFSNHNDTIQAVQVFTLKSKPCFSLLEAALAVFVFSWGVCSFSACIFLLRKRKKKYCRTSDIWLFYNKHWVYWKPVLHEQSMVHCVFGSDSVVAIPLNDIIIHAINAVLLAAP